MKRMVLFDIDGTLVHVEREISRRVLIDALRAATGHTDHFEVPHTYQFHGRTDRMIFADLAEMIGVERDRALEVMTHFEHALVTGFGGHLTIESVRLLPGITLLLERLETEGDIVLGLLTGNLEGSARAKLAPHDLNRYFPFGAYGSDGTLRTELPPIALERANGLNGTAFTFDDVVIIGDSHRDIECAKAWGIRSLAVATGGLSVEELGEHSPDVLMATLEDIEAVLDCIYG